MGEKKELREENAELRQRVRDLEGRAGQPTALERVDGSSRPLANTPAVLEKVAAELGIESHGDVDIGVEILSAIDRIKNPDGDFGDGPQVTKGDSLAQAIEHNAAERQELHRGVAAARMIVQRVAGALGVIQWDADGTEILEKAQRFGTFAYALKRRGEQYVKQGLLTWAGVVRVILIELVAPKDLAKFVAQLPEAPQSMVDQATEPAPPTEDQLSLRDVQTITNALSNSAGTSPAAFDERGRSDSARLRSLFVEITNSTEATASFRTMMNLVILPHVRRLRVAR